MHDRKLFVCDELHPDRCIAQGKDGTGQCTFLSVAGMTKDGFYGDDYEDYQIAITVKHCPKHHGEAMVKAKVRKRFHDYQITVWQRRINEFSESERVKTLRGEIAIIRMLIENTLNSCQDTHQLMIYSSKVADLVTRCEKLVSSCDRIESSSGLLLDKSSALAYGGKVVDIITRHVNDPDVIERISNELIDALKDTL